MHTSHEEEITVEDDGVDTPLAQLTPNLRTIHALWTEYDSGLGGRKPAKLFTSRERGKQKYAYYKHKLVWDKIEALIRAGNTWTVACDKLYSAYGQNKSPSQIMKEIQKDNREKVVRNQRLVI